MTSQQISVGDSVLSSFASAMWPTWFPEEKPPLLEYAVLNGGPAHEPRAIGFLLPEGEARPRVVLKVAFTKQEAFFLENEFHALTHVRTHLPSHLLDSIPAPLGLHRLNGWTVEAVRGLAGHRIPVPRLMGKGSPLAKRVMTRFFSSSFAWSEDLAHSAASGSTATESQLDEVVDQYIVNSELDSENKRLVRSFRHSLDRFSVTWSPSWQHGDIAAGNVLIHGSTVRFVDWEHAGPAYEPWFDAAYAPVVTSLLAKRQEGFSSLREAALMVLPADAWVGRILKRELDRSWNHPIPLPWAVTLAAMRTAVRRRRDGRRGWGEWAEFVSLLLTDRELRTDLAWLSPDW